MAARIAAAAGDASALLSLAIELAQEVSRLSAEAAVLDERRKKDAARKRDVRGNPQTSEDHPGQARSGADVGGPLPPAPSLLPPTPPNNPSSPPIPASSAPAPVQGTPEAEAEARLLARFDDPADRAGVERFLGYAADGVKRVAWCGRLGALLDRPPHFTPGELAEGLEALLTQDVGTWGPALLKAWVRRVRADAAREVLADAESRAGMTARQAAPGADGAAAWEFVTGELLRKQIQRTLTMDDLAALGPRSRAALRAVGGLPSLSQHDQRQRSFARRDFLAAFDRAASPTTVNGAAA
jgi:hypothetical protein